jgi:hypothetical protein
VWIHVAPDNSDNQWWVDAFTIEPTSLLTHSTVISKRGMKQDAVENSGQRQRGHHAQGDGLYCCARSAWRVVSWSTLGPPWVGLGRMRGFKRWITLSTHDKVYVSEFHHFNSAPCACTRRLRRASLACRGSGRPAGYRCRRGCAGCPGSGGHGVPSSDQRLTPSCFWCVPYCCSYTHATLQVAYMLEQELAWRSSMLRTC